MPDGAVVAVDGDEREVGARRRSRGSVRATTSVTSASSPSGRRRRRCARTSSSSSRSSGQATIDTPSTSIARRQLARAVGAAPRTSAPGGSRGGRTVAGRRCAARRPRRRCACGRFALARLAAARSRGRSPTPSAPARCPSRGGPAPPCRRRSSARGRSPTGGTPCRRRRPRHRRRWRPRCRSPSTCARSTVPRRARSRRATWGMPSARLLALNSSASAGTSASSAGRYEMVATGGHYRRPPGRSTGGSADAEASGEGAEVGGLEHRAGQTDDAVERLGRRRHAHAR